MRKKDGSKFNFNGIMQLRCLYLVAIYCLCAITMYSFVKTNYFKNVIIAVPKKGLRVSINRVVSIGRGV